MRSLVFLAAITWAWGCSSPASEAPAVPMSSSAPPVCGPGKAARPDRSCFPVGPSSEESEKSSDESRLYFVRSEDGWGRSAVVAPRCSGDSKAALSIETCAPIDECAAPFPPPEATHVVSMSMMHAFSSIAAALKEAKSGDVIAIDRGEYAAVNIEGNKNVTLVGRCARESMVGGERHNAVYVDGAKVQLRGLTLSSTSSPIAVKRGTVDAEHVIVRGSKVGIGAVGSESFASVRHSLIEGLGTSTESMGAMAAQGGTIVIEDLEIRGVSTGIMVSDPSSHATLRRTIVRTNPGSDATAGLVASAEGELLVEDSVVSSDGERLVGVLADKGTTGSSIPRAGKIVMRSSVLEQVGSECDCASVHVSEGGELSLADVTLRHRAKIGLLIAGKVDVTRTAILGDPTLTDSRAGVMGVGKRASFDAQALAIPWAQGAGVGMSQGRVDLRGSLVAHVAARGWSGQAGLSFSGAIANVADCEVAHVEGVGIASVFESSVNLAHLFLHDTVPVDGTGDQGEGVLALGSNVTLESSTLERNAEGVVAAGSAVVVTAATFKGHRVAVRAMNGMAVREDSAELTPRAISLMRCAFEGNATRVSLETLPTLNAPVFEDSSRK